MVCKATDEWSYLLLISMKCVYLDLEIFYSDSKIAIEWFSYRIELQNSQIQIIYLTAKSSCHPWFFHCKKWCLEFVLMLICSSLCQSNFTGKYQQNVWKTALASVNTTWQQCEFSSSGNKVLNSIELWCFNVHNLYYVSQWLHTQI